MEPKRYLHVTGILNKVSNDEILFYDDYTELFFKAKPYQVFMAEQKINKILDEEGSLNAFEYADALGIDIPEELSSKFENAGWDIRCLDGAWARGIEFDYDYIMDVRPENSYYVIRLNVYPCDAYGECQGGCG